MKTFSDRSLAELKTLHPDLRKIFEKALSISKVDFGISEGHRTAETQQAYYAIGRTEQLHRQPITNIDGITQKGKHNYLPSEAGDLFVYHPDPGTRKLIAWDKMHFAYIAGIIDAVAESLLVGGEINHRIRWGGNWDGDGIIDFDQKFDDFPHFELIDA